MNRAEKLLLEKSADPEALFVFPTDVAVSGWAGRLLELRLSGAQGPAGAAAAMDQFCAWDTFKKNSIRSRRQNRTSIPGILRKIFAGNLARENAEKCRAGKEPVFHSIIPEKYPESAAAFTSWLASILPQLGPWHERASEKPGEPEGAERDLLTLTLRYRAFLDEYDLFEPAWEKPPFDDTGRDVFVFFPDCLSDFPEYREILENADRVTLVYSAECESEDEAEKNSVYFYGNSRSEITAAALYVRAIAEAQAAETGRARWEQIAVSIPEDAAFEACVIREFANRNIPLLRRRGKPLASWPAGRLFTAIARCYSGDFSFESVAALLLDTQFPWKDPDAISQLVDFGIRNNCVSGWTEDGKKYDSWLDSFSSPAGTEEKRAEDFYRTLKRDISAINRAGSFKNLAEAYFVFREHFFEMERCSPETDMILSRCVSELLEMIEIETLFPGLEIPDPFTLLVEHLREKIYLPRQNARGVSLLPYRTAAPVPFEYHIVLEAGLENLQAVFTRFHFLPRSRREELGVSDTDAAETFIRLHRVNASKHTAFFCAEETFSGFSIPHPLLGAAGKPRRDAEAPGFAEDLFGAERRLLEAVFSGAPCPPVPALHSIQAAGFDAWKTRRGIPGKKTGESSRALETLRSVIAARYGTESGKIRVSATALKDWNSCGLIWLFGRVLGLENISMEAPLMAEHITGTVYHAILDAFFRRLKTTGGGILKYGGPGGLSPAYRAVLAGAAEEVFSALPFLSGEHEKLGALAVRMLVPEKPAILRRIETALAKFAAWFDGYRIIDSEKKLDLEESGFVLTGKVDCILEDSRESAERPGPLVIVDFKLKNLPKRSECQGEGRRGLENFQLPAYITLAEKSRDRSGQDRAGQTVQTALFFSILDAKPLTVFGAIKNSETGGTDPWFTKSRIFRDAEPERFGAIMAEFSGKAALFAETAKAGVFSAENAAGGMAFGSADGICQSCPYRRVCRSVYSVGGEFISEGAVHAGN